jgi:hypothetical protein
MGRMTQKNSEKKRARALQERTGWSYSEALRCARTMTSEAIEKLIAIRANKAAKPQGDAP